jgi:hypothetical protein
MPFEQFQQFLEVKHASGESIEAVDNQVSDVAHFDGSYQLRQLRSIECFAGVPFVGVHLSNAPVFAGSELPTHINLALARTICDIANT